MATADITIMELLLKQLLKVNDAERSRAEQAAAEMEKNPESYLVALSNVIRTSTLSSVRNLACILIRQKLSFSDDGVWCNLSPAFQLSFKNDLVKLLETEKELNIREKICQSIGELGLGLLESGSWPELLPTLFAFSQSLDPSTRLSGLSILHYLAPYLAIVDKDDFPNLLTVFQQSLKQHDHPLIQVEACRSICALLLKVQTHETLPFVILIPLILRALGDMLNHSRVAFAREIIKAMSDLVEIHPTFFKQNLESLINALVSIARPLSMDSDTRQSALEFLAILIENSPVMIRALPPTVLVIPLLHILFSLLVTIDEDPSWELSEDEPDDSDWGSFPNALNVLGRVSNSLRGRVFLPPLYTVVDEYMRSDDWRCRHAVMFALSQVAEIVTDLNQRETICKHVIASFHDTHPRVRYASVRCLGQLATDFQPYLQEELSVESLNAIFSLLDIDQPVRVRFITAAALSNFVDGASPCLLQPVLSNMMNALAAPLQASSIIVQQQIMFAIASIADCVGDLFSPYYSLVMPIIKSLYMHPPITTTTLIDASDLTEYRANALECITCVGMAVGGSVFNGDARDVLEVMYGEGMGEVEMDGTDMKIYMMTAWGRMCTALKDDFIPYLSMIVPILLKTASQEIEMPGENELNELFDDMENMSDDSLDLDSLGIRTNAMDEKATACRVLSILVDDLHSALLPYLPPIMHTLLPLLNTSPFQDIKLASLAIMPELLVAIADAITSPSGIEDYRQSFLFVIDTLLQFITEETELDILIPALQTLSFCLEKSTLTRDTQTVLLLQGAELARLCDVLHTTLISSFERRALRSAEVEQVAWDEEEVEEYREIEKNENTSHFWISKNIGELLHTHSSLSLPLVHEILLSDLCECSDESRTAGDRLVGIYVMAKIIEFCGKDAFPYYPQFIPVFLREIHASDAKVREVVAEGLGKAAEIGKDLICEIAPRCVKEAEFALDDPVSREACYNVSNRCDIVMLGQFCYYLGNYLIMSYEHLSFWLRYLPICDDNERNAVCMEILCGLLERGDCSLVGDANQNIPRILQILCRSVGMYGEGVLERRMLSLVKSIEIQSSPQLMNGLWECLGVEKSELIKLQLSKIQVLI